MAAGLLQFIGFLYAALTTAVAGLLIFGASGGSLNEAGIRAWLERAAADADPAAVAYGVIGLAWLILSLPGFLLMAIGVNVQDTSASALRLAEISRKLDKL